MTSHSENNPSIQERLSDPARARIPYTGLDRMAVLVSSLGTLRIALMGTVNSNSLLDAEDCSALAAFVALLEDDFEKVIEELYEEQRK